MDIKSVKLSVRRLQASLDFADELLNSKPQNELDYDNIALKLKHAKKQSILYCMELDKLLK